MTLAESKDSFEISSWGRLEGKGTAMCLPDLFSGNSLFSFDCVFAV